MDEFGWRIGEDVGKQVISDISSAWRKAACHGLGKCTTNRVGM
jgi:hypothetical protein